MATKGGNRPSKDDGSRPGVLVARNPATGEVLGEVPANSPAEAKEAVEHARKVFPEWAAIDARGRARMLGEVRRRISELIDDIVEAVSSNTGKPRAEALVHDVLPPVMQLAWLEKMAPRYLRPDRPGRLMGMLAGLSSRVEYRPFGVVGAISPWNYPFSLGVQAVASALAAGNTAVLKPSEATPQVGEVLKRVFEPLPAGVLTVVQGAGDVGAALVDAPCDKICFIGSPATGRKIAEAAAKHLTPVVMELGGKDPAIVCADADPDHAAAGIAWGSFLNAGQTCAAIERIYVVDQVADDFERALTTKIGALRRGQDGDLGSLTLERQLEVVKRHVEDALGKGARVLVGGPAGGDDGLWYAPTVLKDVNLDMAVMREETFGPVVVLTRVRDEDEAVRRANEDGFNLTASVWTKDHRKGVRLAQRIRAGAVLVNEVGAVGDGVPWMPWGGVGESGYGRINGPHGLREFTFPVHVGRKILPGKSVWWYPYDEPTTEALRATIEMFAARSWGQRLKHIPRIARGMTRAIRAKL